MAECSLLGWLTFGLGVATFLVLLGTGIVVAWYTLETKRLRKTAEEQVRVSQRQIRATLRLGLYRRRAAILHRVIRAIGRIDRAGFVTFDVIPDLLHATTEKDYLVDDDLRLYLDEVYRKAVDAWGRHSELEGVPPGDERSEILTKEHELVSWLRSVPIDIRQRFIPYLRIREDDL